MVCWRTRQVWNSGRASMGVITQTVNWKDKLHPVWICNVWLFHMKGKCYSLCASSYSKRWSPKSVVNSALGAHRPGMIDRTAEQISRLLSVTVAETGGFVNHHFQYSERCCIYFAEIVFVSDIIRCSQLMWMLCATLYNECRMPIAKQFWVLVLLITLLLT